MLESCSCGWTHFRWEFKQGIAKGIIKNHFINGNRVSCKIFIPSRNREKDGIAFNHSLVKTKVSRVQNRAHKPTEEYHY
mgnify:CR=1 FL=1